MVKLIIFDLDGVLADTEVMHLECLQQAIREYLGIDQEFINLYVRPDGTTTKSKLLALANDFNLSIEMLEVIDKRKQQLVNDTLAQMPVNISKKKLIETLARDYVLAIGSNSRKSNVDQILNKLKIKQYFSLIVSGDMVSKGKPDPEIFTLIIDSLNVLPQETLILEDSSNGQIAALRSGAYLLKIGSVADTNLSNIQNAINKANNNSTHGWNGIEIL